MGKNYMNPRDIYCHRNRINAKKTILLQCRHDERDGVLNHRRLDFFTQLLI